MTARRIVASLLVTLFLVAAGGPVQGAIPAELAKLLPADPPVLVVVSSIDDFDAEWSALLEAGGADAETPRSLVAVLGEDLPGFAEVVDRTRPLALAVDVSSLMMSGEPDLTFVFPVKGDLAQLDYQSGDAGPFASLHRQGDYAVLSTAETWVAPTASLNVTPQDGILSLSVDIQNTLGQFLPFAMMGLGQLSVPQPDADGNPGEAMMSPEEVAALSQALQDLVGAMRRFEMALRRDGGNLTATDRLVVDPAGPLAPGPQPDFTAATALSGLLPDGADLVQASALDLTRPFALLKPLYMANFMSSLEDVPADQREAVAAWFEDYLGLVDWTAAPMAAGARLDENGAAVHALVSTPDAEQVMAALVALADRAADLELPFSLTALPARKVDGVDVVSYAIELDVEDVTTHGGAPSDLAELEKLQGFMSKLLPELHLARTPHKLVFCADDDPAALATLIAGTNMKFSKPDERIATAARRAGPHTQQVTSGDLAAFLRWTFGMIAEMEEDADERFDPAKLGPLPCEITTGVDADGYTGAVSMARDDVLRLVREMAEMADKKEK